jgi:hypothetical protein
MKRAILAIYALTSSAIAMGCGTSNPAPSGDVSDASPQEDAPSSGTEAGGADATSPNDGGKPDARVDAAPVDAAIGPLSCSTPGNFATDWSGTCGTDRWSVKTGTDKGASSISLLPELTTIVTLSQPPQPGVLPFTTRVKPMESTMYALRNVRLTYVRLESDSDYHLVVADNFGANTMITEIPYPGSCTSGSSWQCLITRARAAVDAQFPGLVLLQGRSTDTVVSVAGVGFWDTEHGQFGASPNGIELHPLLAICFGADCSFE